MFTINNYESASQQRPTSSYFIYNDNDNLIQNYPTGVMEGIRVLAINQDLYGNKVLPNTFVISSSAYFIADDGFGNLYNISASDDGGYFSQSYIDPEYFVERGITTRVQIGNIYYAQGLAIITNQDYQNIFPLPPIAKNDSGNFLTTDPQKTISASLNDYARSGTLDTGSLVLSGSTSGPGYSWSTGSNGTIVLTTTIPGTYTVYYTIGANVAGSCAAQLRSNKAKVTAYVTTPTTTTTTSTTTTTTTVPPTTTTTTSTTTSTTTAPTTTTTTTTSTTTSTTTPPPTTTTTTTTSTTTSTTTPPPTTTTTSTTTSTTTPPVYYYYAVRQNQCNLPGACTFVADRVARSSTPLSTVDGVYYKVGSFTYQIQTEIDPVPPPSFDVSLDGAPSDANCITACGL